LVDRPIDAGQGQDKGQPRSKDGGGRGRRRRRKPDGNRAEGGAPKDAAGGGGRGEAAGGQPRQQGKGRGDGGGAPRPGQQGGRPPKSGGGGNRGGRGDQAARQKQQRGRSEKPAVKPAPKQERPEPPFKHVLRRYAVAIFDTHQAAKAERDALVEKASAVDQLNIVIRAEGSMDDPELTSIGNVKVFAGTAWALIHDRRVADGWYNEPR